MKCFESDRNKLGWISYLEQLIDSLIDISDCKNLERILLALRRHEGMVLNVFRKRKDAVFRLAELLHTI